MKPHRARRILIVLLVVFGPLVGAELGVRLLVLTRHLPVAAAQQRDFEISWANLMNGKTPEVLLLGDSVTQQGLNPAILQNALNSATGQSVRVFDAATPSASFALNLALVDELAQHDRLPRVAIIGIQPGELRDGSMFREVFLKTPMGRLTTDCAYAVGYSAWVNCEAEQGSYLWRWRGHPKEVLASLLTGMPTTSQHGGLTLRSDGFREGRGISRARLTQEMAQAQKDGSLPNARLSPDQESQFVRLVQFLRGHGVVVAAVSVPSIPPVEDQLNAVYPGWTQRYDAALAELEKAARLHIVRLNIRTWFRTGDARNPKHLSVSGATKLTHELWDVASFRSELTVAVEQSRHS